MLHLIIHFQKCVILYLVFMIKKKNLDLPSIFSFPYHKAKFLLIPQLATLINFSYKYQQWPFRVVSAEFVELLFLKSSSVS